MAQLSLYITAATARLYQRQRKHSARHLNPIRLGGKVSIQSERKAKLRLSDFQMSVVERQRQDAETDNQLVKRLLKEIGAK